MSRHLSVVIIQYKSCIRYVAFLVKLSVRFFPKQIIVSSFCYLLLRVVICDNFDGVPTYLHLFTFTHTLKKNRFPDDGGTIDVAFSVLPQVLPRYISPIISLLHHTTQQIHLNSTDFSP